MWMLDCSNKEVLKVLNLGRDYILIYLYQNVRRMQREDCSAEMYWWGVDFFFKTLVATLLHLCAAVSQSCFNSAPSGFFFF